MNAGSWPTCAACGRHSLATVSHQIKIALFKNRDAHECGNHGVSGHLKGDSQVSKTTGYGREPALSSEFMSQFYEIQFAGNSCCTAKVATSSDSSKTVVIYSRRITVY